MDSTGTDTDENTSTPVEKTSQSDDNDESKKKKQTENRPCKERKMEATDSLDDIVYHPMFAVDENYEKLLVTINRALKQAACVTLLGWLVLLICVYRFAPQDSFERLSGVELSACYLAFSLVLVSNVTRVVPLIHSRGTRAFSGVILASITVQFVAFSTDFLMAFIETPVVIDPITNSRVHLFRWCEWIPLAFLMTFLTEAIDLPDHKDGIRTAYFHASCQALSSSAGLFFPFAPNFHSWCITLICACALFFILHVRCALKYKLLRKTQPGNTVNEMEVYDRIFISYRLMRTCSIMWTFLVVLYFAGWVSPLYASENSILSSPAMPMLTETFCEVWSKILYLAIVVEAQNRIFDEGFRAERRLEELKYMMSVVWQSSSDVITISVQNKHTGNSVTMISPTVWKLINTLKGAKPEETKNRTELDAIVFELPKTDTNDHNTTDSPQNETDSAQKTTHLHTPQNVHTVQLSSFETIKRERRRSSLPKSYLDSTSFTKNMSSQQLLSLPGVTEISELIVKAWNSEKIKESLMIHGFKNKTDDGSVVTIDCEAKVTRLNNHSLVIILRDISERCKRFEAEKKIVMESTARKKDAEANRFTRHEVKNGLLAAIGLTDSLRETCLKKHPENAVLEGASSYENISQLNNSGHLEDCDSNMQYDTFKYVAELDTLLREVLDTILQQAMARDLIHEVYVPRVERVNICSILRENYTGSDNSKRRFPLVTYPDELPLFLFDAQLLRLVYRNAISNACKYGKQGGTVTTELHFDSQKNELKLDVINEPGENHGDLLNLGAEAEQAVFLPGKRLFPLQRYYQIKTSSANSDNPLRIPSVSDLQDLNSSGDGAWIIDRCAKTLGGNAGIKFLKDKTVFSLKCPITPVNIDVHRNDFYDLVDFKLPENTWGIAIDDSKIQRKLMMRFLLLAGIDKDKIAIKGKDSNEIQNFPTFVMNIIKSHPNDYFLVIADENLDIVEMSSHHKTVSGSYCIELIRQQLDPGLEKNMFCLIRSANDSSQDIALYTQRAHGFLPKTHIRRDSVIETLAPLWRRRFNHDKNSIDTRRTNPQQSEIEQDFDTVGSEEILQTLEIIDALCGKKDNPNLWPAIWDKLHLLKGDLKSISSNIRVMAVAEAIDHLRGPDYPEDLVERWQFIRSMIRSIV